jgi:hemerythrin-like metal-binding protein
MRKPYLPYWLYEASPFLYIAAGLLVHLTLDGPVANFSAALLILAGGRAIYLRWNYRRSKAGTPSDNELALVASVWDPACDCEHEGINAEHHALFTAAHALMEAAMASHPDIVNRQIQELIRKIRLHFRNEEAILHQTNATIAATHKLEHEAMEAKIGALHRGFVAGKIRRHELIDFIVIDVIAQHTRSDKIALEKAFWG